MNRLGLDASSGYGVACKIVNFAMLVPSALMQSMASFVSDYYVIALVGMVSNFFLSFYKLIFGRYFFSIGIKAKNNKNYKKAINYFNKGFQVYPSFSGFLVNLGLIYFDLKDYEKAIVYFDKAIGWSERRRCD